VSGRGGLQMGESGGVVPPLATWPADLPAAVEALLRKGGGVVFFAGPELQPAAYATAWGGLLPALPGDVQAVELSPALAPIDAAHPLWGGFGGDLRDALRKVPLKTRRSLTVSEGTEVMARYADEGPLVARRQVGSGRALFVNTSPDRAWGDWSADGALFVPSVHMLMSAVVASASQVLRNSPGTGIVGVPFDVRVAPAFAGTLLRAGDRTLTADADGGLRGLGFDHPGLFDILTEDGRVARPVAVNFPPDESRREFFRPAILQRQIEARRRVSGSVEDAPRINLASESGWWRWILAALAVVWLVEPWLAFRPGRDISRKGVES